MPLQPSSLQDIACAIVQQFLETCWSAALQLPPEPAFRIPITLEVALGEYDDISYSYGGNDEDAFFCLDESLDSCRDYMCEITCDYCVTLQRITTELQHFWISSSRITKKKILAIHRFMIVQKKRTGRLIDTG